MGAKSTYLDRSEENKSAAIIQKALEAINQKGGKTNLVAGSAQAQEHTNRRGQLKKERTNEDLMLPGRIECSAV